MVELADSYHTVGNDSSDEDAAGDIGRYTSDADLEGDEGEQDGLLQPEPEKQSIQLQSPKKPSSPRKRKRSKPPEYRIWGFRPITALLLAIPTLTALVIFSQFILSISHRILSSPSAESANDDLSQYKVSHAPFARPTGHNGGDAATLADNGEWAKWGEAWNDVPEAARIRDIWREPGVRSNGTITTPWRRTLIMVSIDGFRPEYLKRGITPDLEAIAKQGIQAEYLESIFPSLTFPNHWSIQTGLYAESHGIVANNFYDPSLNESFSYQDPFVSWKPHWWHGEPFWETAEKQGIRTANLMWPGPPKLASGVSNNIWYPYQSKYRWALKIYQLAKWLDMPSYERPQLMMIYLPEIDKEGHAAGPDSGKVSGKVKNANRFAQALMQLVSDRNLTDIVDVIFLSDHGMTNTHDEQVILLDDLLGPETFAAIEHKDGWPSCGLWFNNTIDIPALVERLKSDSLVSQGAYQVFTPESMPQEWHYSNNNRIAPIYLVPSIGWVFSDRKEYHEEMKGKYDPLGNHGYDPSEPDMRAIFLAHGPFANTAKQRLVKRQKTKTNLIPGFKNIEIYNLVARLLDLKSPAPNNGTRGFWDAYLEQD